MKNYLKDKKVLVGLVIAGALAYYFYDKNKKAKIKADAQAMASTPATTTPAPATTTTTTAGTTPPIVKSTLSSAEATKVDM